VRGLSTLFVTFNLYAFPTSSDFIHIGYSKRVRGHTVGSS
jgi:hypothetical protein